MNYLVYVDPTLMSDNLLKRAAFIKKIKSWVYTK